MNGFHMSGANTEWDNKGVFSLNDSKTIFGSLQQSSVHNETLHYKITFNKALWCWPAQTVESCGLYHEQRTAAKMTEQVQAMDQTLMTDQAGHLSKIFRFAVNLASAQTISKVPIWLSFLPKNKKQRGGGQKSLINSTKQSAQLIKANPSDLLVSGPMQQEPSIG